MWTRAYWIRLLIPLGLSVLGLTTPMISRAQGPIAVSINEFDYKKKPYLLAIVDVDPARQAPQLSNDPLDWLDSMQSDQQMALLAREVLEPTQALVEENFNRHRRESGFSHSSAYEFADPSGLDDILVRVGAVRPKTKIDDVLSRRSVTVTLFEGRSLKKAVATLKIVKSDFARIHADLKKVLPDAVFQRLSRMPVDADWFNLENLSADRSLRERMIPFLVNVLDSTGVLKKSIEAGRKIKLTLQTSSDASGSFYESLGFEPYFHDRFLNLAFFEMDGARFKSHIDQYFSRNTIREFYSLPWLEDKPGLLSSRAEDGGEAGYMRSMAELYFQRQALIPVFTPDLRQAKPWRSCNGILLGR